MTTWYLLTAPALLLLIITATARLADLGREDWSRIDHIHRIGLIAMVVAFSALLITPFAADGSSYAEIGWRICLACWGLVAVWITKRGMIPWWDFILGVHRDTEEWKALGWRGRIRGELGALRASFKPHRFRKPPLAGPKGPLP